MNAGTYADDLKEFVNTRISTLFHSGTAGGAIAALRRSNGSEPGSEPALWEATLGLPERYAGHGDAPSAAESAVFAALTLWARHQRGTSTLTHRRGQRFGSALSTLGDKGDRRAAVSRRLYSLATASNPTSMLAHGRGLVDQLAAAKIPVDFAQMAVDFMNLQNPKYASGVRVRWGREFMSPKKSNNKTTE